VWLPLFPRPRDALQRTRAVASAKALGRKPVSRGVGPPRGLWLRWRVFVLTCAEIWRATDPHACRLPQRSVSLMPSMLIPSFTWMVGPWSIVRRPPSSKRSKSMPRPNCGNVSRRSRWTRQPLTRPKKKPDALASCPAGFANIALTSSVGDTTFRRHRRIVARHAGNSRDRVHVGRPENRASAVRPPGSNSSTPSSRAGRTSNGDVAPCGFDRDAAVGPDVGLIRHHVLMRQLAGDALERRPQAGRSRR